MDKKLLAPLINACSEVVFELLGKKPKPGKAAIQPHIRIISDSLFGCHAPDPYCRGGKNGQIPTKVYFGGIVYSKRELGRIPVVLVLDSVQRDGGGGTCRIDDTWNSLQIGIIHFIIVFVVYPERAVSRRQYPGN